MVQNNLLPPDLFVKPPCWSFSSPLTSVSSIVGALTWSRTQCCVLCFLCSWGTVITVTKEKPRTHLAAALTPFTGQARRSKMDSYSSPSSLSPLFPSVYVSRCIFVFQVSRTSLQRVLVFHFGTSEKGSVMVSMLLWFPQTAVLRAHTVWLV